MKIGTLCYINDGGKLIPGETPEECVIREVYEESGLTIKNPTLRGIMTFPKFDDIDDWLVFLYTSNEFKGNLIESDEGILNWINNNEILNLNLWDGDKIYLAWLKQDKFFSAKFIYKNRELKDYSVTFY